jgi:hypothetical protein
VINTVELHWVRRSKNRLADRISNEGVSKEGSELDTTWINILQGQFRIDYTQLVTKYRDNNLSKGGHIEEGNRKSQQKERRTQAGYECPTLDYQSQCQINLYNRREYGNKIVSTIKFVEKSRGKASTTNNRQLMM